MDSSEEVVSVEEKFLFWLFGGGRKLFGDLVRVICFHFWEGERVFGFSETFFEGAKCVFMQTHAFLADREFPQTVD